MSQQSGWFIWLGVHIFCGFDCPFLERGLHVFAVGGNLFIGSFQLGLGGLAIGLALQGTLSNVAAGLMLVFLRPFKIGDWIEAAGMSGSVREIGLFTTIIDTFDNVFISVPNSAIWSSSIVNHSRYETRRLDLDIGIDYGSDLDKAEAAIMSLTDDPRILKDPKPRFIIVSYDDSAITIRLRLHSLYADFFDLGHDLRRQLKTALDSHGIGIPFPTRVIHMHDTGNAKSKSAVK